jgi:hypothetical protein
MDLLLYQVPCGLWFRLAIHNGYQSLNVFMEFCSHFLIFTDESSLHSTCMNSTRTVERNCGQFWYPALLVNAKWLFRSKLPI